MYRIIEPRLIAWKERKRRKPLVVRGARQVGKTYSLKKFGEQFENFVNVDLERHPEWASIFAGDLSAKEIRLQLEIVTGKKITPGRTLLFIDEIQSCPRAIMSLRYFYEDIPGLHVVAAGSLLEFALQEISFPVGRVQFLQMAPLSFYEYLLATNHEQAAALINGAPHPLSAASHSFLMTELRKYFFIGGMPESIGAFVETGSMQESFEVQAEIGETWRLDFAKYKPRVDYFCLYQVLTGLAQKAGRQIKYSHLSDDFSNPTIKKAFNLLCMANIARKVSAADPSGLPLEMSASAKIFKALLLDIGLMRYLSGMAVDTEYAGKDLSHIFRGAMAEQFVGQEMVAGGTEKNYYWSRRAKSSSAEVDFLAVVNDKIYPVEVKSGSSGRLKSLHLCLDKYKNCPAGLVFSDRPYQELPEQNLIFLPLYFAYSATRNEIEWPDFFSEAISLEGKPVSEIVIEGREDRF